MRRLVHAAVLVALAAPLTALASGPGEEHLPHVMILGTYHMGNPNQDVYNAESDDVRSPKRQKELAELVRLLARFRPTKILVEAPYGSTKIEEQYRRYLAGTFELPSNEREQIAFPLAKLTGARIVPIDVSGAFDLDPVATAASTYGQTATLETVMNTGKVYVDELNAHIKTGTIVETLRWMNADARVDEGERLYLRAVAIGKGDNYAGATLTAGWHERNLKIFANIVRETSSPDERLLVVYGAGHAKLLTEFAMDSGMYVVERPSGYLERR